MAFTLHYNAVARVWFEGQATIPPVVDPDDHVDVQVLKPFVSFNDYQNNQFGRVIVRIIIPLDIFPYDPTNDPNGLGTTINIDGSGAQHYYRVIAVAPVCSDGDVIAWQCWCANTRYL
jgi:hypothetical protein